MVKENKEEFKDNEIIRQLLDKADYRGKFGYVIFSYEEEFRSKKDMEKAQHALCHARKAIILMHLFVMKVLGNLKGL